HKPCRVRAPYRTLFERGWVVVEVDRDNDAACLYEVDWNECVIGTYAWDGERVIHEGRSIKSGLDVSVQEDSDVVSSGRQAVRPRRENLGNHPREFCWYTETIFRSELEGELRRRR